MADLAGHFLLFTIAGIVFLLAPLILGLFVRPTLPTAEKSSPYECGEPAIGTSYIQFDLRFYVVALLFILFDVEVAFFFPWGMVYGSGQQLMDKRIPATAPARVQLSEKILNAPPGAVAPENVIQHDTAFQLVKTGLVDILVFFAVLLVGFAYVWKRGDLDWVRAVQQARQASATGPPPSVVAAPRSFETVG